MQITSLEYYHEEAFLTRLSKQIAKSVSNRMDKVFSIPLGARQSPDEPECGGYNEAFIVQHWASYSPRN